METLNLAGAAAGLASFLWLLATYAVLPWRRHMRKPSLLVGPLQSRPHGAGTALTDWWLPVKSVKPLGAIGRFIGKNDAHVRASIRCYQEPNKEAAPLLEDVIWDTEMLGDRVLIEPGHHVSLQVIEWGGKDKFTVAGGQKGETRPVAPIRYEGGGEGGEQKYVIEVVIYPTNQSPITVLIDVLCNGSGLWVNQRP